VAAQLQPGKAIAYSGEAHYTHGRMAGVLGLKSFAIPVDRGGRMDLDALRRIRPETIGTVVVTAGTTSCGAVDPVDAVVALARERGWRVHVDAAYGGFYATLKDAPSARLHAAAWHAISSADSIVVDPHKHGLQPYGCGCVLFADPRVGALYKHDSPATYFASAELHLGEISLECSRAGAAAAALWATLRCFPLTPDGLGRPLLRSRLAALAAYERALAGGRLAPVVTPQLDIFTVAPMLPGDRTPASTITARTERLFTDCAQDSAAPFHFAKLRIDKVFGCLALPDVDWDRDSCVVIRSVLMKPEHLGRVEEIVGRLEGWRD